tara:strand:+ start:801 stop:920 length:120 start_codon:yes stop_codon:yes gene_type:complete
MAPATIFKLLLKNEKRWNRLKNLQLLQLVTNNAQVCNGA